MLHYGFLIIKHRIAPFGADMTAPSITTSTTDERLTYVRERFACISNCDLCGNCAVFHGVDPEHALTEYVEGRIELREALRNLR